jgi:hypothetical protein
MRLFDAWCTIAPLLILDVSWIGRVNRAFSVVLLSEGGKGTLFGLFTLFVGRGVIVFQKRLDFLVVF